MGFNHVRMEEHLLPVLQQNFQLERLDILKAYGGLWTFFLFIGRKNGPAESKPNPTIQILA
ncbi:MAG TPA: hypothetical protein DCF33_10170 [Saprospirales bacterium]|nr:hypothetical protein [Saprospirales bacterium]